MADTRITKLARTLVNYSTVLREKDMVGIVSQPAATPLVQEVYREVLRASRAALLTAFATGKVLVVLPMLVENTRAMFEEKGLEDGEVSHKQKVIEQLEIWSGALMRITKAVTKLAPYGVFAIAASAAGTMPGEDAGRLQVFLLTYVLAALVLAFWVLPALVTALTPIGYRDLFDTSREAIVIDNVLNVNHAESRIKDLLSVVAVRVTDPVHEQV